jgi:hypothetical protein
VRRVLIFALALSLAGLGLCPPSTCAMHSSKMGECATPETQSQCDQMSMDESGTQFLSAPDRSCCSISKAPIPESRYRASDFSSAPQVHFDPTDNAPRTQRPVAVFVTHSSSPPSLQSLLCTFLI